MSDNSIENKTVRPGSLLGYSYYTRGQSVKTTNKSKKKSKKNKSKRLSKPSLLVIILIIILAVGGVRAYNRSTTLKPAPVIKAKTASKPKVTTPKTAPAPVTPTPVAPATVAPPAGNCNNNTLSKLVVVSISQRHLWACAQNTSVYDSAVVTGISYLAADLTPTGTYRVYEKETNITLTGSDSTGSWNDFVNYWMPFLSNQYGVYGFHDATWRSDSDFGNISPDSSNASHGCVELPLSTAQWLYNWVQIGTPVTIES